MPLFTQELSPKMVWALPLLGALLAGCGHRQAPAGAAPAGSVAAQQQQAQVRAIQNNPRLPAEAKAAAIQALQARGGGAPR